VELHGMRAGFCIGSVIYEACSSIPGHEEAGYDDHHEVCKAITEQYTHLESNTLLRLRLINVRLLCASEDSSILKPNARSLQ